MTLQRTIETRDPIESQFVHGYRHLNFRHKPTDMAYIRIVSATGI
jgi:hypothetical protein